MKVTPLEKSTNYKCTLGLLSAKSIGKTTGIRKAFSKTTKARTLN